MTSAWGYDGTQRATTTAAAAAAAVGLGWAGPCCRGHRPQAVSENETDATDVFLRGPQFGFLLGLGD